jgi:RecQ-mediated genome instability protein 1
MDPATQMDALINMVDAQLLQSDLADSMLEGTGLPLNVATLDGVPLPGPPVLVEVVSITDIGASAFQLQNVRQMRVDRTKMANIAAEDDAEEVDEDLDGPMPKYPRSMLQLELSDGTTTLKAVEYRPLPELVLGSTPLGFKVCRVVVHLPLKISENVAPRCC